MDESWLHSVPLYILLAVAVVYFLIVVIGQLWWWESEMSKAIRNHGTSSVGLPLAGLAAYCVVYLFPFKGGESSISATILAIELKGPACQAVLWIVAYAVIMWSMWLAVRINR